MPAINAIADWASTLNPFALAGLTVLFGLFLTPLIIAIYGIILAIRSGAGEGNPEEAETEAELEARYGRLK